MTNRGRKRTHKGIACRRGQPIFYDEPKKPRNFSLTDTAVEILKHISNRAEIPSLSETLEQILRGKIDLKEYLKLETDEDKTDQ